MIKDFCSTQSYRLRVPYITTLYLYKIADRFNIIIYFQNKIGGSLVRIVEGGLKNGELIESGISF